MADEEGPPESLELRAGQDHTLRLKSLGTAGYQWTARAEPEAGVVELSHGWAEPPGSGGAGGPAIGASVDELITVHAVKEGTAVVHLEQRRPWEKDKPPAKQQSIQVVVRPAT